MSRDPEEEERDPEITPGWIAGFGLAMFLGFWLAAIKMGGGNEGKIGYSDTMFTVGLCVGTFLWILAALMKASRMIGKKSTRQADAIFLGLIAVACVIGLLFARSYFR